MSRSDTLTEKSLIDLEKRLKKEYTEAQRAVSKKTAQYFKVYADREQDLIDRLDKGEVNLLPNETPENYLKKWRSAQLGRGERWKALKNDLADRMTRTNEIASAYINDRTPSIYSINQSYQAYEIGKGLEGISFTLYDEQTVKNLIADNDERFTSFKTVKVNPKRDYEWNAKQIQHKLVSGILQGQTIKEISAGFLDVMQRNESSALRNARTAYTSAQNGGRIDGMRQAKAQGIEVRKQWLSSHDGRVRDSHAMLNGQIRDIEDRFDNGLMYPADSEGRPAEVYNCRCTLTYIYPKYDKDQNSEIYADEKLEGETYPQFVKRMNKDNADLIAQNKKRYENGEDAGAPKTQKSTSASSKRLSPEQILKLDYDVDVKDLDQMDQKLKKECLEEVVDLLNEFPKAKDYLREIEGYVPDSFMVGGDYAMYEFFGSMRINTFLMDAEAEKDYIEMIITKQTAGSSAKNLISHEMGHTLERAVLGRGTTSTAWTRHTGAKQILKEARSELGITIDQQNELAGLLSAYALESESETMAECIASIRGYGFGYNPLADKVWDILKKRLG